MFTLLSVAIHHGTVHHTPPSAKFVKLRDLPLPKSNAVCGNGDKVMYSLNQSDVLGAIKKFHHNCNSTIDLGGVGAGIDVFAKHGSALAFMCNYGGKWRKNDEFDVAFNMIKSSCDDHSGQNTGKSSLSEPIFEARARRAEGATEWTEQPNGLNLIKQSAIPICKSAYHQTVKDGQKTHFDAAVGNSNNK